MAKRRLKGARTIVTGASSGIGRELARQLAASGARVLATARRAERLQELELENMFLSIYGARDESACRGSIRLFAAV